MKIGKYRIGFAFYSKPSKFVKWNFFTHQRFHYVGFEFMGVAINLIKER